MSNSVRPHRWQPTRLPHPWDSPGKNTGVGCHFRLQCMKVESESEVAQSYLTLSDPMDCSLPGSSIHGIFQARLLESSAFAFTQKIHYKIIEVMLVQKRNFFKFWKQRRKKSTQLQVHNTKKWELSKLISKGKSDRLESLRFTWDYLQKTWEKIPVREFDLQERQKHLKGVAIPDSECHKDSDARTYFSGQFFY